MQPLRTLPRRIARLPRTCLNRQTRRNAHDSHGDHHAPAAQQDESFGRGFFITLAAIPISLAAYKFSTSGDADSKPLITSLIESFTTRDEVWQKSNSLHTQAVEMAGDERALFFNGDVGQSRPIDLRFPEAMNSGSPYNVPAGHGSGNIDAAIAKYQKQNYEENARKLQDLANDNIRAEKPFESKFK